MKNFFFTNFDFQTVQWLRFLNKNVLEFILFFTIIVSENKKKTMKQDPNYCLGA